MQAVRGYWGDIYKAAGMVHEEYLIILGDIKGDVYIAVELTGRPTIGVHVALITREDKRLGFEPMKKHWRHSQTGQTSF